MFRPRSRRVPRRADRPQRSLAAAAPSSAKGDAATLEEELDRQLDLLVERDYPAAAGIEPDAFRGLGEPLRQLLAEVDAAAAVPFVVVSSRRLVPATRALEGLQRRGRRAASAIADEELGRFEPIEGVDVPAAPLYLLAGVDTGADLRNVTPDARCP